MTAQDADELRARHHLRRLGARPLGHQEPPMNDPDPRAITPTRVIPAGAPLPPRPPEPGEDPPWRTPPPPPPTAGSPLPVPPDRDPEPRTVEVRHVHEVVLTWADPDPEPDPWWARLWDRVASWRMASALVAALTPWAGGESPVGAWSHTVHQARADAGIGAAYVIAGVAVGAAWVLDRRSGRWLSRFLFVTASLGALGVLHWWDPFQLMTGVDL